MLRAFFRLMGFVIFLIGSTQVMANEIWIDVRTTDEFNAGHIQGAAHIPYEEIAARIGEVTEDKNAVIRLYCRTGRRSGIAQETLQAMGFTQATNEGGYEDLVRAGHQ